MKYVIVWFLGLLLGGGLGVAAVYYNPLLESEPPQPAADDWVLSYAVPSDGAVAFTHGSKILYPRQPSAIEELWEDTINHLGLGLFTLKGGEPAVAVAAASRVSVPSARSEFLTRGPLLTDYWLLTVPGEGSLFLEVDSSLWRFFKDTLLPVRYLGRPWRGPVTYEPTVGPRSDHNGRLYGASGRFRSRTGSVSEKYVLEDLTDSEARFRAELSMHLDPSDLAADESAQP
jgi:hypothetical protein